MDSSVALNRRYQLEKELGRGGFCVTWLAHPKKSREPKLVVKELQLEKLGNWQSLEQFESEARLLSHLHHAHIPDFVDFISEDTPAGRRLYLVQECIVGDNLETLLADGRYFTEAEVRNIALTLAQVLEYLHGFSPPIIHRDLKPGNIMLRASDDLVFLVDFGAVKAPVSSGALTVTGTVGFMPIEQIEGRVVPASDLYALGMTLIQVLSHQDPNSLPKKGLKVDFRPAVNISAGFARILDRLIEPDLRRRYASASELIADLEGRTSPVKPLLRHWKLTLAACLSLILIAWLSLRERTVPLPAPAVTPASVPPGMSSQEYLHLGNDFYASAQYALAANYYSEALKGLPRRPETARTWFNLAYSHTELGDYAQAVRDYDQALQLDPKVNSDTTEHNLGYNYYLLGDYASARKHLSAQLAFKPEHLSALNYLGLSYLEEKQYAPALEAFNRAIAIDPNYRYPYNNRGRLYHDQGQLEQALLDYDRALAADSRYSLPHYNKAELYYDQGKYLLCINEASTAIGLASPYASAHNMRGLCHHGLKQYELAIDDYQTAIAQKAAYPSAHYNLGLAYDDVGKPELAIAAYQQALKLQPAYARPLNNLGYIYERQGKLDMALSYYTRALETEPEALYFTNRGNLYRQLKNCPQAHADWKIACAKGSQSSCKAVCP
ncbi:MAG TPA: tetratricopeptide repeat protein [Candidatus Obscuribacterales bacterium]